MNAVTASWLVQPLMRTAMVAGCCAVLTVACTKAVDGLPTGSAGAHTPPASATASRAPAGPVGPLLLAPGAFPPSYPAVALDSGAAGQALRDLTGAPTGATVDPAACTPAPPPAAPQDAAVAVGANDADSSTITVAVARVGQPLAAYKAQLQRCPTFRVTGHDQVSSTVTATETVAPPINADDSVAVNQTVSSPGSRSGDQTTLSLIAQIADIRIMATYMTFQGTEPDAVLLDQVFTAAVLKVHDNFR